MKPRSGTHTRARSTQQALTISSPRTHARTHMMIDSNAQESIEVYERSVGTKGIRYSVEMWLHYIEHMIATSPSADQVHQ